MFPTFGDHTQAGLRMQLIKITGAKIFFQDFKKNSCIRNSQPRSACKRLMNQNFFFANFFDKKKFCHRYSRGAKKPEQARI